MSDEPTEFTWSTRVYWEDTDGGGVVYHANYLRYMERARTEWLRSRGVEQGALLRDERVQFVVSEMQIVFAKPARLDDEVVVTVRVTECRGASFAVEQRVVAARDGAVLCRASAEIVCLDADRFRPTAMSGPLRSAITMSS